MRLGSSALETFVGAVSFVLMVGAFVLGGVVLCALAFASGALCFGVRLGRGSD